MSDSAGVRKSRRLEILKFIFVLLCWVGFLYQGLEFLFLYRTYPTMVDIQEISPSILDMPAFTICNAVGYNIDYICNGFNVSACVSVMPNDSNHRFICRKHPEVCADKGDLPEDYQYVQYEKFMREVSITPETHEHLRMPLEKFLNCTIEFAGSVKSCTNESVIGSFYTKDDLPQYCYSLYSLWGKPYAKREVIQKGAIMKLKFDLNASRRFYSNDKIQRKPRFNLPAELSVQIGVHSPYFLYSPHIEGMNFLKGRAYEMRLTMAETHLLPAPYKTNCTNYTEMWEERDGKSPINQQGVVKECQLNKTYEALKCIPIDFDFPHNYTICRSCPECDYNVPMMEECSLLADSYNQPCHSITYFPVKENRMLTYFDGLNTKFIKSIEGIRFRIPSHNCTAEKYWSKDCSEIQIDVVFDTFQTKKLTYNPKYEDLELFSAIGGYMGMWLGISLLTVYDYAGILITSLRARLRKRKLRKQKKRANVPQDLAHYTSHI